WLGRRRSNESINKTSSYFFALPENNIKLMSEVAIIDRIVNTIRSITGDNNFHIHHLRHSFATWTAMSLIGTIIEDDFDRWDHLPATKYWLRTFPKRIEMHFSRNAQQRNLLYQLSTLLGHSTPAIGLEHYIHGIDLILGDAVWRYFKVKPTTIGPYGLNIPLRTFQRWSAGGWPSILDNLARKYPLRCLNSLKPVHPDMLRVMNSPDRLYEHYYHIWQTLKIIQSTHRTDNDKLTISINRTEDVERWHSTASELRETGLIKHLYPTFPSGSKREAIIKDYANKFDQLSNNPMGYEILMTLCKLWKRHKLKDRCSLRFHQTSDAKIYIDCLQSLKIPWSQIKLTWIGSRFTHRQCKHNQSYWRKSLNLSRRITINTQSLGNDRPLRKSKGYMDIRVINKSDKANTPPRASQEFQWLIWMTQIDQC
ncbi:MAG: hypothetical protein OQK82_07200, partial [Candidatus Pacearchaeota archaeon]|nr:hypothetical protein [Candidatus Pacearchaeota archaeon]